MRQRPVVLVTGASTGLGLALARLLLEETDYRLVLTARRSSLPRFPQAGVNEGPRVRLRALDITSDPQRRAVIDEAARDWGGVDILVNNAGIAYRSVVEHTTDEERLIQMDVNYRSPMELIRLALPGMRRKRAGRILNVSSVGGMMAMPTMAVYSASKFALEGATEALWYEVRPWNIRVTLVQPGFINSDSFHNVRLTHLSELSVDHQGAAYHAHYRHMGPFIERLMRWTVATPEKVARKMLRAMRRSDPPLRLPATPDASLFALLRRVAPRRLYHRLLYRSLPRVREWGREEPAPTPRPGDERLRPESP